VLKIVVSVEDDEKSDIESNIHLLQVGESREISGCGRRRCDHVVHYLVKPSDQERVSADTITVEGLFTRQVISLWCEDQQGDLA